VTPEAARKIAPRLLGPILRLQARIRDEVVAACERQSAEDLSRVAADDAGDTIYAVDRVAEEILVEALEREQALFGPVVLIAEGLSGGQRIVPEGAAEEEALWRVIVDPIDGTRGLMYQKRSAWVLSGVAPNRGPSTSLRDVVLAAQTEIPLVKQHLCDQVWAIQGGGASARRRDRLSGSEHPLTLRPSRARTIAHGFATVSRFFPGAREELAAIDEQVVRSALGPVRPGKAHCFEDQYICSGGQLYELMAGHDRFVADLRPLAENFLRRRGLALGLCAHPYDLCTELIARELGVVVTDAAGEPLKAPLSVEGDLSWVGYANEAIRSEIEALLQQALRERGLLEGRVPPG
jgi:fructose-1,6-bisphosphatase/inositol monophosphatase family enzyme